MELPRSHDAKLFRAGAYVLGAWLCFAGVSLSEAANVVVQLRNGDRITGDLLAQETNHIVVKTTWAGVLALPVDVVGGLRSATGADLMPTPSPAKAPAPAQPVAAAKPPAAKPAATVAAPAPTPAKKPTRLKNNIQLGSNLAFGARDQESVYFRLKSTYDYPYPSNPKKFFRTIADYTADYGETENIRSANRMSGSLKSDFDLGAKSYFYKVGSVGYDEIRKIDLQYALGPGMGYRMIKRPTFEFDLEGGLDYQVQERSIGDSPESIYFRAAENTTWKVGPRLTLTKKFEFFVNGEDAEQFRFRLDANANYKLLDNVSLNLTVLDQYDTAPAPRLNQNELQFRSAIGITF